jgi:DNA replication protein DnaC
MMPPTDSGGVQLLILDDWGLEPLDAAARHDLFSDAVQLAAIA